MGNIFTFEKNDKFFVKFFLLDSSLNLNLWGVTESALKRDLHTFVGKPFIWKPEFDHPDAVSGDQLLITQEEFRVGDIVAVGLDADTGKAWGIAEIYDQKAIKSIKDGEVNFVSPSIVFNRSDTVLVPDGSKIINHYEAAHVAAVQEPAYGVDKAQIKGKCSGDSDECLTQLDRVEASLVTKSKCGKFLKISQGKKSAVILNELDIFQSLLDQKIKSGDEIDVAVITTLFSKSKKSSLNQKSPESKLMSKDDKEKDETKDAVEDEDEDKSKDAETESKEKDENEAEVDEDSDSKDAEEKDDEEEAEDDEDKDDKDGKAKLAKTVAKLSKELASLKKEQASIKSTALQAKKNPIIATIVQAKTKLPHRIFGRVENMLFLVGS